MLFVPIFFDISIWFHSVNSCPATVHQLPFSTRAAPAVHRLAASPFCSLSVRFSHSRTETIIFVYLDELRTLASIYRLTSGVSGLTGLPAVCGKHDNAPLSATLNLSMSKISGIMWAVGTCSRAGG